MELTDVRRLTGTNLIMNRPGAVGEAVMSDDETGMVVAHWRQHMHGMLDAIGWTDEQTGVRRYPGGASLMVSAPVDALYAATDLVEWAWEAAQQTFAGKPAPDTETAAAEFSKQIAEESDTGLRDLADAAQRNGVAFLHGDDLVSLGLGTGCRSWPDDALPPADTLDWPGIHDAPVAMVTGTNGKSTTVRLTAAIGAAAGLTVGQCSSDWVRVGGEILDEGDYSGPAGARMAVRDQRVDLAVLEVARGGLLRRGLAVPWADAALITNLAADHLGDYGITDVPSLGEAKFLVAKAVRPDGRLVLNADDPELVRRSTCFDGDITWFSLSPDKTGLPNWIAAGGDAVFLRDDSMMLAKAGEAVPVMNVADFPLSMGGAARFNISNALGAIGLAAALDLPVEAMARGLAGFQGTPDENPGRGNMLEIGGVRILVDFAHNPHGVAALVAAIQEIPATRRLFLLGQAGDRSDEDIRELTRIVWDAKPERIIVKELESKLRGRQPGEVPALIAATLDELGAPHDAVMHTGSEMEAVRQSLLWAQPGDFLVLLLHSERNEALTLLDDLRQRGWSPGTRLDD